MADPAGLNVQLLFEKYYAAGLGRFRISVTTDPGSITAATIPGYIEDLLAKASSDRTADDREILFRYFVSIVPELAAERAAIQALRDQLPQFPTTLVMAERPVGHRRTTHRHHRGEFLQPREAVEPGVLSCLPGLPKGVTGNRLTFAGGWSTAATL